MERESTSRLTLDDVCGKEPKNFKKDRLFQNHYRTHAEEKFVCEECPSVWSGGPQVGQEIYQSIQRTRRIVT